MQDMTKSFTGAMKQFFGLKDGQQLKDFAAELKALTPEDKMEFHRMLNEDAGIPCDPPGTPAS
jgi:hypothetical protein